MIRAILVVLLFVSLNAFSGKVETAPLSLLVPHSFYVGLELGQQRAVADQQITAFDNIMEPYDLKDLAMRVSLGYRYLHLMALEMGFTSFPGFGYRVSPNLDSIHYGFYSLDMMVKLMVQLKRIGVFVAGGGALMHTQVDDFYVYEPITDEYQKAHWIDAFFLRPRVSAGVFFDLTARIRFLIAYAYTLGTGHFGSTAVQANGVPSLTLNSHYLPNISFISAAIVLKIF